MAAAAAALTLASPLRRLLRAPGVVSEPYYFIARGRCSAAIAVAAAAARDSAAKGSVDRNAAEEVRNILDMVIYSPPSRQLENQAQCVLIELSSC